MLAHQANLEVVAVEPNEAMVKKFKALQPHIEIQRAAAQELPFEDSSFDAVCAAQVSSMLHICRCMTRKSLHVKRDFGFAAQGFCCRSLKASTVRLSCRPSTGLQTKTP